MVGRGVKLPAIKRAPRRRGARKLLLRTRIALITAAVVALSIIGVSVLAWLLTRHHLLAQLDDAMAHQPPGPRVVVDTQGGSRRPSDQRPAKPAPNPPNPPSADDICDASSNAHLQPFLEGIQVLRANGSSCAPAGVDPVVTTPADRDVRTDTFRDGVTTSGDSVRVLIRPMAGGDVLLTSRSMDPIDNTLSALGKELLVVSVLGVGVAAAAGLLLTRSALAPMSRLTRAAEHIAATEDLSTPVEVGGRDEVGRLGRAFTAMTGALSQSRRRQRELVTDAAHELRTPLTSLRTNIDLLARSEHTARALAPDRRAKIVDSLQFQAGEFTDLINELVALARSEREFERLPVAVATVIDRAVRRATNRAQDHEFEVCAEDWTVTGDAAALERMVLNLLDNAAKFSPAGSAITVRSRPGWLTVTDAGPGIAEADREHVFDRFWRAADARALPGSGLGLAIVANTVTAHGGTVRLAPGDHGMGTTVRVELPIES
ncbi:MAG: HAMP domain-containing histidine kinase [Sciscionella sp.]|nr:HAMP domain-containing histidine kinase [Sciscionella sp.]